MKGICGVFPVCDGNQNRICQGKSYGTPLKFGGTGSGASFKNNVDALARLKLKMRVIGEHVNPDTGYEFFGQQLSMPIMAASTAGVNSFGGEEVISEIDFCTAVVEGCKQAGTIGWRGHAYNYKIEEPHGINAIANASGWGVKIVKPMGQNTVLNYLQKAEEAGCIAVGVDVDGCGSYATGRYLDHVQRKNVDDLRELIIATNSIYKVGQSWTPCPRGR